MKFICAPALLLLVSVAPVQAGNPAYWKWAPTPPMGWNSYDGFGDNVTEAEVMANATFMEEHLLPHGWNTVVVDYRWYDPGAHDNHPNARAGAQLAMDSYGRLLPAANRFPSAADGKGFAALAEKLHAMGLKFGIHIMRGIPRQAVARNTPIEGSSFHAADAANTKSVCGWCKDMYGVDASKQAGQDYYDSLFRLYASWGLDFVKVDDLSSRPYSESEIEAVRKAIDKCGRPIVFSTSPGETPVAKAGHISTHANMWRISEDFWDNWRSLNHAFDLDAAWQGVGGPGRWPDSDMIPFGKLSIGNRSVGPERVSGFTHDEQVTLMSLWCLMPSPLMLGGNLPDYPPETRALLTNDEVLAVDQDPLGQPAKKAKGGDGGEIWVRELADGSKAIGLFNREDSPVKITLHGEEAGLKGSYKVRDLWQQKDEGEMDGEYSCILPAHGSRLLKFQAALK